jgi:hypothetical protein
MFSLKQVLRSQWHFSARKKRYNTGTAYTLLTTILTHHLPLGIEVACMLQCTVGDVGPATVALISWSGVLYRVKFPLISWKSLVSWGPHLISHPTGQKSLTAKVNSFFLGKNVHLKLWLRYFKHIRILWSYWKIHTATTHNTG